MAIDAKTVASLREMSGAGMMDAKKALEETGGDLAAAMDVLKKKGLLKAASKSDRDTKEGRVHAYLHSNSKLGAMVEVLCETDFVSRNEAFHALCNDIAMHVSAADPLYVKREDVPADLVEKQQKMFVEEMAEQGKPAEIVAKIVEGKMNKWYGEIVLLEQSFVKDDEKTVGEMLAGKIATIGENMQIARFARFIIA